MTMTHAPPGALLANHCRLDAVLGRGGMGTVYRAHDMLLGCDVAVEMLSAATLGAERRAHGSEKPAGLLWLDHDPDAAHNTDDSAPGSWRAK